MKSDKKQERPEAYPKPAETDTQLKNQSEYTERQSDRRSETMPANAGQVQNSNTKRKRPQHRDIL